VRHLLEGGVAALDEVLAHHGLVGVHHHPDDARGEAEPGQYRHVSSVPLLHHERLEVGAVHGGQQPQLGEHLQAVHDVGGEDHLEAMEEVELRPLVLVEKQRDVRVDLRDDGLRDVEELDKPLPRDVRREGAVDPLVANSVAGREGDDLNFINS